MMTEYEFTQLLATFRKSCGFMADPGEPLSQATRFNLLRETLKEYPQSRPEEKVIRLTALLTECRRYLSGMKEFGHCFKPKFLAVRELMYEAAQERKTFSSPQQRATAQQRWANLKKVYGPTQDQGGKKLGEHYWKEVFDPHHRPPHFFPTREVIVGGKTTTIYSYDELFDAWKKMVDPASPDYDPTVPASFYRYLDAQPDGVPNRQEYKYLEDLAERETFQVVGRGGRLMRKIAGDALDTRGWELNNGLRNADYEGSAQSMLKDHFIWVMSMDGQFYSGPQTELVEYQPNRFRVRPYHATGHPGAARDQREMHHSGFLGGAPVGGGGEWHVVAGMLKVITGSSGHYAPPFENFQRSLRALQAAGVRLSAVAAEWPYKDETGFKYFNAKQLAMSEVAASWLGWPRIYGTRPLRPVLPLNPLTCQPIPVDVPRHTDPAEPPRAEQTPAAAPVVGGSVRATAAIFGGAVR